MDTRHIYDAGYDIVNNLDGVLDEFDKVIGLTASKQFILTTAKTRLPAIRIATR